MARSVPTANKRRRQLCFADVFAGCGGLSLGLLDAGWIGRFAIEKNQDAFNTLAKNLIDGNRHSFAWPKWLPIKASTTANLLSKHKHQLAKLRGRIDLLAGGPPCQGFSFAGRRVHSDPRNSLFKQYLSIVKKLDPRFLLVENVQGFAAAFEKNARRREKHRNYSEILTKKLQRLNYSVFSELSSLNQFGVPQNRKRFILIAIKVGDSAIDKLNGRTPFEVLRDRRELFLRSKHLSTTELISAKQAIADLEVRGKSLVDCSNERFSGFKQIRYVTVRQPPPFVKLMRQHAKGTPDSIRLPRHNEETIRQFRRIMTTCRKGRSLNGPDRKRLGIKKHVVTPLHPGRPASTITTLPDDLIHYGEEFIRQIRSHNIYTEVIFYSASPSSLLWDAIHRNQLEGVFVSDRPGILQKLENVAEQRVHKVLDVNNMRGIVMAEVGDMDLLIEDILKRGVPGLATADQTKIFTKFHGQASDQAQQLAKKLEGFNESPTIEIMLTLCDSYKRWLSFLRLKQHFESIKNFNGDYFKDILSPRNFLAHGNPKPDGDGYVFEYQGKQYAFNKQTGLKLRNTILEYRDKFQAILNELAKKGA
jgi:DNA (cytosine-5)-methyltransferase 1